MLMVAEQAPPNHRSHSEIIHTSFHIAKAGPHRWTMPPDRPDRDRRGSPSEPGTMPGREGTLSTENANNNDNSASGSAPYPPPSKRRIAMEKITFKALSHDIQDLVDDLNRRLPPSCDACRTRKLKCGGRAGVTGLDGDATADIPCEVRVGQYSLLWPEDFTCQADTWALTSALPRMVSRVLVLVSTQAPGQEEQGGGATGGRAAPTATVGWSGSCAAAEPGRAGR